MNFFELLGFQPQVDLDLAELRKAYIALQMGSHPDLSSGNETHSTDINQAYETLKNKESRILHLLSQNNLDIPIETDANWLMEMMEWNERIEDAQGSDEEILKLNTQLVKFEEELWNGIFDIGKSEELNTQKLEEINKLYFKSKFIKRLQKILNNETEI